MRRGSGPGLAIAAVAGISLLVALGLALPVYWVYLLTTVAIAALIARSVGLLTNQAGLITLCQMAFAAIGGWVVSWIALAWPGAPFLLLVLLGGVAAASVGLLLGLATARIRGVELAVVTLGFGAALDLVLRQGAFPGVGSGTPVIPSAPFDDPRWFFALCWAILLVLQSGSALLGRTAHGLGWAAIRTSERAAAALGMRVGRAKASAFGVGSLFAGVAGGLLAGQYGLLTTAVFTPLASMMHLVTAVLCGASLFSGAVLAGVFSVFMPEALRRLGLPLDVGNALLAIGAFDVLRRGGGGIAEQARAKLQDRAFRGARVACELPGAGGSPKSRDLPPSSERGTVLRAGYRSTAQRDPARRGDRHSRQACLEISGLSVSYGGNRALDAVDLTVRAGEVHALIGSNGAGKTTLIDAVTGFATAHSGIVRVDGAEIDRLSAQKRADRGVRRTFQQGRAIEALSVGDYLRLAVAAESGGRAAETERVRSVSAYFGLPDANVPIRLMDAGSRRVLEIAGALASGPRVLLLDEPAAGSAETESRALAELVRRIPAEFGCTVLLIEHDMGFVRAAATRVTVLDDGRVLAEGAVDEVLADPRVVAAYLGEEVAR